MTFEVLSPVPGKVVAMEDVPDPVFAQGLVGPGTALVPDEGAPQEALAPIPGRILKLHPHAFVIVDKSGAAVLVHLGIDTVTLDGEGFTVLRTEGDTVAAGDPIIRWDPAAVRARGLDPIVPVVVMNLDGQEIVPHTPAGQHTEGGVVLLSVG